MHAVVVDIRVHKGRERPQVLVRSLAGHLGEEQRERVDQTDRYVGVPVCDPEHQVCCRSACSLGRVPPSGDYESPCEVFAVELEPTGLCARDKETGFFVEKVIE